MIVPQWTVDSTTVGINPTTKFCSKIIEFFKKKRKLLDEMFTSKNQKTYFTSFCNFQCYLIFILFSSKIWLVPSEVLFFIFDQGVVNIFVRVNNYLYISHSVFIFERFLVEQINNSCKLRTPSFIFRKLITIYGISRCLLRRYICMCWFVADYGRGHNSE